MLVIEVSRGGKPMEGGGAFCQQKSMDYEVIYRKNFKQGVKYQGQNVSGTLAKCQRC